MCVFKQIILQLKESLIKHHFFVSFIRVCMFKRIILQLKESLKKHLFFVSFFRQICTLSVILISFLFFPFSFQIKRKIFKCIVETNVELAEKRVRHNIF